MKCPICTATDLLMTDRLGIEIDYCPQRRGVWLDRGELDKIIERSVRDPVQVAMAPAPQVHRPAQAPYDSRHDHHEKHHNEHSGYRRKKSIWQELFD
jgi:Zn-finger nucleic acid-binding protein